MQLNLQHLIQSFNFRAQQGNTVFVFLDPLLLQLAVALLHLKLPLPLLDRPQKLLLHLLRILEFLLVLLHRIYALVELLLLMLEDVLQPIDLLTQRTQLGFAVIVLRVLVFHLSLQISILLLPFLQLVNASFQNGVQAFDFSA